MDQLPTGAMWPDLEIRPFGACSEILAHGNLQKSQQPYIHVGLGSGVGVFENPEMPISFPSDRRGRLTPSIHQKDDVLGPGEHNFPARKRAASGWGDAHPAYNKAFTCVFLQAGALF